ncbi:DUF397 domain-containing protein [Streptomyces albiflaviniger]|nr:DUF397 domain-containing protein [Streptomyces albiflaviniger]
MWPESAVAVGPRGSPRREPPPGDSKDPEGRILTFTPAAWAAFQRALRASNG